MRDSQSGCCRLCGGFASEIEGGSPKFFYTQTHSLSQNILVKTVSINHPYSLSCLMFDQVFQVPITTNALEASHPGFFHVSYQATLMMHGHPADIHQWRYLSRIPDIPPQPGMRDKSQSSGTYKHGMCVYVHITAVIKRDHAVDDCTRNAHQIIHMIFVYWQIIYESSGSAGGSNKPSTLKSQVA